MVDIDEELKKMLPKELEKDLEIRTHVYKYSNIEKETRDVAIEQLLEYKNNAKLVVTSRLHCALPCIAMGIPTVLAKEKRSYRFEGVDRMVRLYDKNEYSNIDWNPHIVEYEKIKETIISFYIKRLRGQHNIENDINLINSVFSKKGIYTYDIDYISDTLRFIEKIMVKESGMIHYYLWGVTPIAYTIYRYITSNYPASKLEGVVDKKKRIVFCGKETGDKEVVVSKRDAWVFVCTRNAIHESKEFFIKKEIDSYYQCFGDVYEY